MPFQRSKIANLLPRRNSLESSKANIACRKHWLLNNQFSIQKSNAWETTKLQLAMFAIFQGTSQSYFKKASDRVWDEAHFGTKRWPAQRYGSWPCFDACNTWLLFAYGTVDCLVLLTCICDNWVDSGLLHSLPSFLPKRMQRVEMSHLSSSARDLPPEIYIIWLLWYESTWKRWWDDMGFATNNLSVPPCCK